MRRPPAISANTFRNSGTARLLVPKGKKGDYLSAEAWKDFASIEEH